MKTALTVWANRISPVFDAARTLLIVTIHDSKIQSREYASFDPDAPSQLAIRLLQMDAPILICGAISQRPALLLETGGIQLIPFITGRVEDVLEAHARATLIRPAFLMPGCQCRRRRRRGEAVINGPNVFLSNKEVIQMPGKDQTGPRGQGAGTGKGQGGCKSGQGRGSGAPRDGRGKGRRGGKGRGGGQGKGKQSP